MEEKKKEVHVRWIGRGRKHVAQIMELTKGYFGPFTKIGWLGLSNDLDEGHAAGLENVIPYNMEHVEGGYNPQEEGEIPIPNPKPIEIERILVIEQNQEHDKPVPVSVSFPDTNSFFVVEVLKKGLEKQTSTLLEMMKLLFEKFSSPGSPVLSSPSGRQVSKDEEVDSASKSSKELGGAPTSRFLGWH
ncbi:hypothetical protein JCGZ_19222 [Jatropha curcas]|uniref:Uncharacterized protein n=1 Tax=Jatropha curcas TaxID=180498 RepID=A0A067KCE1_JATCU|nr:hypothetical protein JCGZ_19222 [Jatropha curcas]